MWATSLVGTLITLVILSGVKKLKQVPIYRSHIYRKPTSKNAKLVSSNEVDFNSSADQKVAGDR